MDVEWSGLARTGKATVVGGALVAIGTVFPFMDYSGGSASLLQDGKMEVALSAGLSTETSTVANSQTLLFALAVAAVGIGMPLARGWDWKSAVPSLLVSGLAYFLFMFAALMLHGGGQEAVLVGGDPVAETATPGIGLYALLVGTVIVALASLAYLGSAGLAKLRG
jgi:hypothetical protein